MEEERKKLEKIYQALNEEDTDIKKWNQALIPKAILLFPPIAFALTFLKINTDKSIIDLLGFIAIGVLCSLCFGRSLDVVGVFAFFAFGILFDVFGGRLGLCFFLRFVCNEMLRLTYAFIMQSSGL